VITVTSSIIKIMPTSTGSEPCKYELNISGIGSEYECNVISARIFDNKKIKATVQNKETYRSHSDVSRSNDMVKLDLRLSKMEFNRLLKLLDT
jgi:diphthamide synthase (EF-2-diphthine--ammonia ligase)